MVWENYSNWKKMKAVNLVSYLQLIIKSRVTVLCIMREYNSAAHTNYLA